MIRDTEPKITEADFYINCTKGETYEEYIERTLSESDTHEEEKKSKNRVILYSPHKNNQKA
jgi:hypothetical protein